MRCDFLFSQNFTTNNSGKATIDLLSVGKYFLSGLLQKDSFFSGNFAEVANSKILFLFVLRLEVGKGSQDKTGHFRFFRDYNNNVNINKFS